MPPRESRYRSWVFTWNNPIEDWKDFFDVAFTVYELKYLIAGEERGGLTDTFHLQGFVSFKGPVTFKKVQEMLGHNQHVERAKGSAKQAADYCKKDGKFSEWGTLPMPGTRTDLQAIAEIAKSGVSFQDSIADIASYQGLRSLQLLLPILEPQRTQKPAVLWLHGRTGVGKTRLAFHLLPEAYVKDPSLGKWWEGYDAHPGVIIDDLRPEHIPFATLLRLLDRYPCRVETKGGSRQFLATKIVITSCLSPEWFRPSEVSDCLSQLLRRLDVTHALESEWSPHVEVPESIRAAFGLGMTAEAIENGNVIEEVDE